jgi:hypothetical protein
VLVARAIVAPPPPSGFGAKAEPKVGAVERVCGMAGGCSAGDGSEAPDADVASDGANVTLVLPSPTSTAGAPVAAWRVAAFVRLITGAERGAAAGRLRSVDAGVLERRTRGGGGGPALGALVARTAVAAGVGAGVNVRSCCGEVRAAGSDASVDAGGLGRAAGAGLELGAAARGRAGVRVGSARRAARSSGRSGESDGAAAGGAASAAGAGVTAGVDAIAVEGSAGEEGAVAAPAFGPAA